MYKPSKPNGIRNGKYRSLFETSIALQLRNEVFFYEPSDKKLGFVEERSYLPDFYLPKYNVFVECKGYFTGSDRTKMLLVKKQNPSVKILLVFQNENTKLSKSSKTTYGMWAEKHGFTHLHKDIPVNFDFNTVT